MGNHKVKKLSYGLKTVPGVQYNTQSPVKDCTEEFSFVLQDQKVEVTFKEPLPTCEEARQVAEGYPQTWEVYAALSHCKKIIEFEREPLGIPSGASVGTPTVEVAYNAYPEPPKNFKLTPDVDTLWHRYCGYTKGREPLLSMAYFCLTYIQHLAGNRKQAANKYRIERLVLDKLGEITSTRGDSTEARKIDQKSCLEKLSVKEQKWVETAVRKIILQMGNPKPGGVLKMSDLPEL